MLTGGVKGSNGSYIHTGMDWSNDSRWSGITRPYSAFDVLRLRGSVQIEYTLARLGAERLWNLIHSDPYVPALGAITGNQAIEMVQAGLKAIYGSGWQVAADGNTAGDVYPDQSLYPCDSAPNLVKRINRALLRADQIESAEGKNSGTYWLAPIVADAEAGFGGSLNAYELMKAMIEAGAAAVHFEDQLSSAKKCGHLGGKVVVPTREFIEKLIAARLAADVCGVPTILIARTDANSAGLLLSDADPRDREFISGARTSEGFYHYRGGIDAGAPVGGDEFRLQAELHRHVLPQRGELAGLHHQHLVAGRQRVDQRAFPGAGSGRGVNDHRIAGLEDGLDAVEALLGQLGEFRAAVVDDGGVHRPQHAVGQRGRPRDMQEMTPDRTR